MVENENQQRNRVSIINEDILCDKNLTPAEKMVYARICYFMEFFECAETTAEYLGLKVWTVQSAKRKLESLGYIICVRNTGRGKRYVADVNLGIYNKGRVCSKQSQSLVETKSDVGKNKVRLWENQDIGKNIGKNVSKNEIVSIETRQEPEKSLVKSENQSKTNKVRVLDVNGKVCGGNPLTERAYEIWEEVMGQKLKHNQWNSNAGWNMMRAKDKGEDWLIKVLTIAKECKKDPKADFRAKNIANLADLQKNWEYVLDWARQRVVKESNVVKI